jgi:hypothetical protein
VGRRLALLRHGEVKQNWNQRRATSDTRGEARPIRQGSAGPRTRGSDRPARRAGCPRSCR